MTEPTPADTLRAAAAHVRQTWPDLAPLAAWLDREARQEEYTLAEFGHRSACQEALDTARLCLAPQPHGPTAHAQRPQDATDGAPASPAASESASGPQTGAQRFDCPACDAGMEHDQCCPTPETHNAGCVHVPDPGDGLREAIARAIHRYDNHHALSGNDTPSHHHYGEADAVMPVVERWAQQLAAGRATWKAKAEEIERDRDGLQQRIDHWERNTLPDLQRRADDQRDAKQRWRGRAEQAEAAVARVRAECDAIEADHYGQHDEDDDGARDAVARIRAALDGTPTP